MSGAVTDARRALAAKLTAGGVDAVTLDPASLVPFVLVDAVTITGSQGVGSWSSTIPVRIVVAPPGDAAALEALETQLERVLRAAGTAPADPGTYSSAGKDCPAYTVRYPIPISNPDC